MDYLTTRGLVLRTTEYKETDRILTVLSADHGLLTMKARGVRSNRSKLKGACQLLTYAEFTVGEAHGFSSITEATAIEMFPELRTDIVLLSLASYFAQLAEVLSQEDAASPRAAAADSERAVRAREAQEAAAARQGGDRAAACRPLRAICRSFPAAVCAAIRSLTGFPSPTGRLSARPAARPTACGCRCLLRRWPPCAISSPARIKSCFRLR